MLIVLPLMITLFIETIIYFFYAPYNWRAVTITILMNIVLNVTMNVFLVFNPLSATFTGWIASLVVAEVIIFFVEPLILYYLIDKKLKKSIIFGLAANSASLSVGLLVIRLNIIKTDTIALIVTLTLAFLLGLFFAGAILFNEIYRQKYDSNRECDECGD